MAGRVSVQTCLSSVSGTWKTPSTVRLSPEVAPRTVAGTPCSSARAANSCSRPGTTDTSARAADSLNRAVNGSPRSTTAQPRPPYRQASARAIASPPSERSCALASMPAAAAAVTRIASCRSASRSAAGGRPPPGWGAASAHAGPPDLLARPAEQHPPGAVGGEAGGEPLPDVVVDAKDADDRGRVDGGGARLVVQADVAAGDGDAEVLAAIGEAADCLGQLPHDGRVLR